MKFKCKICGEDKFITERGLFVHVNRVHKLTTVDYLHKYDNFIPPKCKHCDKNAKHLKGKIYRDLCGSDNCRKKDCSLTMKKAHSENRHPGWAHINTDLTRSSYPEKYFRSVLNDKNIYDKYHIVEQLPIKGYFLDFAIVDLKIDLEIDGIQHIRDKKAIAHDKKRDDILREDGWKIYRISWSQFQRNKINEIEELLDYIDNICVKTDRYYILEDVRIKKEKFTRKDATKKRNEKYEKDQEKYIKLIQESNIEFHKFGWVKDVALILNRPHQKVTKWMKRFMSEFYERKCFKRKCAGSQACLRSK